MRMIGGGKWTYILLVKFRSLTWMNERTVVGTLFTDNGTNLIGTNLIFSLLVSLTGPIVFIFDIQFGIGGFVYYFVLSLVFTLGAAFLSSRLSPGVGQLVCMVAPRVDVA